MKLSLPKIFGYFKCSITFLFQNRFTLNSMKLNTVYLTFLSDNIGETTLKSINKIYFVACSVKGISNVINSRAPLREMENEHSNKV